MKYLPLVWAALWRNPVETVLTWLAVTVAFALFGLMVGSHATYQQVVDSARMDRLYVNAAADEQLTIGLRQQLEKFDGVTGVGSFSGLDGYYQDPHNRIYIQLLDDGMRRGWSELPLSPLQWDQMLAIPPGVFVTRKLAARLRVHAGDALPVISRTTRADGDGTWPFVVLAVIPDVPEFDGGVIIGNYHYVDDSRPLANQGRVWGFRLAVSDPARAVAMALKIDRFFANSDHPTLSVPARIAAENMAHSSMDMATKTLYIAAAGLFMILFVTANGIAQSVRERLPEFAVLETIGYGQRSIVSLVFAEAAAQCLPGALVGMAVAGVLARWPLHFLPSELANVAVPKMSADVLASALAVAVGLALTSAAVPVARLRRLRASDALRRR